MMTDPLVSIVGTVAGVSVAIVAILALFAKDHLWPVSAAIVAALAALGMVASLLSVFGRGKGRPGGPGKED